MSSLDLVKSVEDFLTVTSNECYQPGEKPDVARSNLLNQLKLEKSQLEHGLNAHTYPKYNCEKCSILLTHLREMFNNPPETITIGRDQYGNDHITAGYKEAVKQVISFVKGV